MGKLVTLLKSDNPDQQYLVSCSFESPSNWLTLTGFLWIMENLESHGKLEKFMEKVIENASGPKDIQLHTICLLTAYNTMQILDFLFSC